MGSIIISYKLNPPTSSKTSNISETSNTLQPSKTHEFAIDRDIPTSEDLVNDDYYKLYYAALAKSVREAQVTIGEELTVWRDVVGVGESLKEGGVKRRGGDGDDNEEEEEGE